MYQKKYKKYKTYLEKNNHYFDLKTKKYANIWLISGLRRSGNHLAISFILSALPECSTYFFNDIRNDDGTVTQFNLDHYKQFNKEISKNIIPLKEFKNDHKKRNLIVSIEDKSIKNVEKLRNILYSLGDNLFTIIIQRDLLNMIASRLKHQDDRKKGNMKKAHMFVDKITIDYWKAYYNYTKTAKNIIIFNYNKFIKEFIYYESRKEKKNTRKSTDKSVDKEILLYQEAPNDSYVIDFCKKIGIDIEKTLISVTGYGEGSSFSGKKMEEKIENYTNRWKKYSENPLIQSILNDKKLLMIQKNYFDIKI